MREQGKCKLHQTVTEDSYETDNGVRVRNFLVLYKYKPVFNG